MIDIVSNDNVIDIYRNDIDMYISLFCEENDIDIKNLRKEGSQLWNALLQYIQRNVFNNKSKLKKGTPYDYDLLDSICDYYIYICNLYAKEISIIGFCTMTGIDDNTIYRSKEDNWSKEASNYKRDVYKKLNKWNEESLSNRLVDGNKNPVGAIAVLNYRHGWATEARAKGEQITALPVNQLPDLKNIRQIAQSENAGKQHDEK